MPLNVKDPTPLMARCNIVYRSLCKTCETSYNDQTSNCLSVSWRSTTELPFWVRGMWCEWQSMWWTPAMTLVLRYILDVCSIMCQRVLVESWYVQNSLNRERGPLPSVYCTVAIRWWVLNLSLILFLYIYFLTIIFSLYVAYSCVFNICICVHLLLFMALLN